MNYSRRARLGTVASKKKDGGTTYAVVNVVRLDTLDGLLTSGLADVDCLDPSLDVVLGSELQHGLHLLMVADVGGTDVVLTRHEGLDIKGREGLVRETAVAEVTADLHDAEVFVTVGALVLLRFRKRFFGLQSKLVCHISAVDDEVKGESVWLGPVLHGCVDEVLGSELECVILLAGRVRDGVSLAAEGSSPLDTEVTKTTTVMELV